MSDSDDMVHVVVGGRSESQSGDDVMTTSEMSLEVIHSDRQSDTSSTNGIETVEDEHTREREDITQALKVIGAVKNAIQFHDDEAFQQALEKVKQRPLIDAGFAEKIELLQRIQEKEDYADFHDVVEQALAQLIDVQEKAKNGKTSLNRPMEVLNEVLPVFEKACSVFTEKVELSPIVHKNLAQCDKTRNQIKECLHMDRQDVEEAKLLEKKCEKLLEEAVRGSKTDVDIVEGKIREEEQANILKWFKDTREETNGQMDYLTSDFEQMKNNCAEDIQFTEKTFEVQVASKKQALEKFQRKDNELAEEICDFLEKEENLKEKLRLVQEHRNALEEEQELRKAAQEKADVVHQNVEDQLQLMLDNLRNLLTKVDTANVVLKQTKDVCNMLFNKSVESKSLKNQDLENQLIRSKGLKHTALIAQAVNCKSTTETQKSTVTYLNDKLNKRKQKLQDALRRKLTKEVKDHQEKLKNIASDLDNSKKLLQRSEDKLKVLLKEISELEQELDQAEFDYEPLDEAFIRFQKQEEGNDGNSMSYTG